MKIPGRSITPKKEYYIRLIISFLVPIIFFFFLAIFLNQYYLNYIERNTKRQYINSLHSISTSIDSDLYEILKTSSLMANVQDFSDILTSDTPLQIKDYDKLSSTQNLLEKFREIKPSIYTIFIYQKNNDLIISSDGSFDIDFFFSTCYSPSVHGESYYQSLQSEGKMYSLLPSETITNKRTGSQVNVIPLIQFGVKTVNSQNIMVIYLSESNLNRQLDSDRLTAHTQLLVIDGKDNIIGKSSESDATSTEVRQIAARIKKGDTTFEFTVNKQKMLAVTYAPTQVSTKTDYRYIALIPFQDLKQSSNKIGWITNIMIFLALIICIAVSLVMSHRIYQPIPLLMSKLKSDEESSGPSTRNEFDFLNLSVENILARNQKLKSDLSFALPYVCEEYLLRLLKGNNQIIEENCDEFLQKYNFSFKYDYFCIAITTFYFTDSFYAEFSSEQQSQVMKNIGQIVQNQLPDDFDTYLISPEKGNIYLIINMSEDHRESEILDSFIRAENIFAVDHSLVQVCTGIGRIHKSFQGMHQSYMEACKADGQLSPLSRTKVLMYQPEAEDHTPDVDKYLYSFDDMNKMYFYLMSADREKATALLSDILQKNGNISEDGSQNLYLELYRTAMHVLADKSIRANDLMGSQFIDLNKEKESMSSKEIAGYVSSLLGHLFRQEYRTTKKINIGKIKEYIDQNYSHDIYLEQLAQKFKVTPKYMSRYLKEGLGMSFMQYLSALRISKAKALLGASSSGIDEIASEVGFNSRNTFIRMFKKLEGITPSEYRNLLAGKGKDE